MSEVILGIIGAGNIARKHLEVIRDIKWIRTVGLTSRTRSKAEQLARDFGIDHVCDNLVDLVDKIDPDALMVLVSADQMFSVARHVIQFNLPFFMEKPPGLSPDETRSLADLARERHVLNMVGFNRRFYSVFHKGVELIKSHGRLLGVAVEGHERFWAIVGRLNDKIRSKWIYANGTHTIDLLRFFGGEPSKVRSISCSHIEKNGDQFAAIMEFESGAIGNYFAHWYSPGGWSVRLFGEEVSIEFKPLEEGVWVNEEFSSHAIEPDLVDRRYKPGFYRQMEAFGELVLNGKLEWPGQDLEEAYKTMRLAQEIACP